MREPHVKEMVKQLLHPGDVFYDIGAHHGEYSLFAAELGAKVFAFEPDPRNFDRLRTNVANSLFAQSTEIFRVALGEDFARDQDFHVMANPYCSGFKPKPREAEMILPMPIVPLGEQALPFPDIIKVDTEGHELPILKGMSKEQLRAKIIVETHIPPAQGCPVMELVEWGRRHRKLALRISKRGGSLIPITEEPGDDIHIIFI